MTGLLPELREGVQVSEQADLIRDAIALRAQGLTYREVAATLGISRSWASTLINDPDGSKDRARKARYGGTCESCGARTDGSNGRANAPRLCQACRLVERRASAAPCGTDQAYNRGCSCDDCRSAHNDVQRARRRERRTPPSHGLSGYRNFGCHCKICTRANNEASLAYKAAWRRRKRLAA